MTDTKKQCSQYTSVSCETRDDLEVWIIKNKYADAAILTQGAQLISYNNKGEKPIIWQSRDTFYKSGIPVRGGIPIIGPWFNALETNPPEISHFVTQEQNAPSHGFLRDISWTLEDVKESDEKTVITFSYTHTRNLLWNRHFRTNITYTIGAELDVALSFENTDESEISITSALHTYFAISDVSNIVVPSFDTIKYIDTLDERKEKIWDGELVIDQERDYIFLNPPTKQSIVDKGWEREIHLETRGSKSAVLWNPWKEKAKALSMFADEEYKEMLCIETANISKDLRTLLPGEVHDLGVCIKSKNLP